MKCVLSSHEREIYTDIHTCIERQRVFYFDSNNICIAPIYIFQNRLYLLHAAINIHSFVLSAFNHRTFYPQYHNNIWMDWHRNIDHQLSCTLYLHPTNCCALHAIAKYETMRKQILYLHFSLSLYLVNSILLPWFKKCLLMGFF